MTREEAKEFLINISYKLGNMSVEYLTEKDGEKMREAIETLEQELPVIPTQKWIPVSERLPEDNTRVLVTVKVENREPKVRSGYYYMDGHFHIDNGDCWKLRDKELLAWMTLPEPY